MQRLFKHSYVLFCSLLAGWLFSVPFNTQIVHGQSPEPIASVALENGTLELYAAVKRPFGLDGREPLFRFGAPAELKALATSLNFGPWQETKMRGTRTEEFTLGFLLRTKNGERPASPIRMVTAYRATLADGKEIAYWPRIGDSPFNEISNYKWDYQLAPLIVQVPKGSTSLSKLEGALVSLPQEATTISMNKADLKSKATAIAQQVVVVPTEVAKDSEGYVYQFVVCTLPKMAKKNAEPAKTGRRGSERNVEQSASDAISFVGTTSSGEKVQPNGYANGQIADNVRRSFVTKLKTFMDSQPGGNDLEAAVMAVMTDPSANFTTAKAIFHGAKAEFESMDITVSQTTGEPVFQTFVLQDIPLDRSSTASTINEFVAKLPPEGSGATALATAAAPAAAKPSAESASKARTWQDASGKFSVTAKLLGVKDGKVALQKEDGSTLNVPLEKLCDADRKYLETAGKK